MLRIATWNCNMAFRKKAEAILKYRPQILIVPECEHPDRLHFSAGVPQPKDLAWVGENRNKGLGIFSYGKHRFTALPHNPDIKLILPVAVTGGDVDFTLLAVWANHPTDKGFVYVGQVWKAIRHYESLLALGPLILSGDLNSNTVFDKPKREGNHTTVVERLSAYGVRSCYHQHFNQQQGTEKHPTHYLYRHRNKPYHLDYCFASKHFTIQKVTVGRHAYWSRYSDHVPLVVSFL